MATLAKKKVKSGFSYAVQFFLHGQRKTMTLGAKYSKEAAEEIRLYTGKVVHLIETDGEPNAKTALWLESMPDDLRKRFVRAGLIEKADTVTLGELWVRFFSEPDGRKGSTLRTYETVQKRFFPYFDAGSDPNDLTKADCLEWIKAMEGVYAEATLAGCVQRCTTVFRWAVEKSFVRKNPFEGIPRRSFVNESKRQFISREWYLKLLDACPDQTWRTLLALCRIGGLRNPSETLRVKWSDVNWEKSRLKVTSPKTEHHHGKDSRVIPIFPEMRVELEKQFEQAEPGGSPFVIDRWRDAEANMRTHFERIIFRAGLQQWPDLFQNLRRSRDIELSSQYPAHVAAQWMGHSPKVAEKYYLFATDEDFDRASQTSQDGKPEAKNPTFTEFKADSTAKVPFFPCIKASEKEAFEP